MKRLLFIALFALLFAPAVSALACGGGAACSAPQVCCHFSPAMGDETCMPSSSACTSAQRGGIHGTVVADSQASPASNQQSNTATPASGGGLTNPLNAGSIQELLQKVLQAVVQIGSIVLVMALVWVGFLFVVAQGNEEKIRDARNALMWTVIGGLILLGATGISAAIQATAQAL